MFFLELILIAGLLSSILKKTGGIQAFLIRHISCVKVSYNIHISYNYGRNDSSRSIKP